MTTFRRARLRHTLPVLPAVLLAVIAGVVAVSGASTTAAPGVRTESFQDGSPVGELTSTSVRPGGLHVTGWDIDPSTVSTALVTWARIDGRWIGSTAVADRPDPTVAKAHPAAGANHGFSWRVPVPEGRHQVCIGARDIGRGTNTTLGCVTKTFDYGPVGQLDSVRTGSGSLRVVGWTYDKDSRATPLHVTITIDRAAHTVLADRKRPDVASAHPTAGAAHGFDSSFPVAQGAHTVCVTAINIGYGTNNSLGCRTVTLDESPVGALDAVNEKSGKLHVSGWAFDPDAPTTGLSVQIAVDGATPDDRRRRRVAS